MKNTADVKFIELCDEIDYWKSQAEYWEKQCKDAQRKHIDLINDDIKRSGETIGIMLGAILDPESTINKGALAIESQENK